MNVLTINSQTTTSNPSSKFLKFQDQLKW